MYNYTNFDELQEKLLRDEGTYRKYVSNYYSGNVPFEITSI